MKYIIRHGLYEQTTADMLFCPNDTLLRSNNGYALVLSRAAGPAFQKALDSAVEHGGAVPEGYGVVGPGFRLSAEYVYHSILPVIAIKDTPSFTEKGDFLSCFKGFVMAALSRECKNIAVPYLAGGHIGFTVEQFITALLDAGTLDDKDTLTCHIIIMSDRQKVDVLGTMDECNTPCTVGGCCGV